MEDHPCLPYCVLYSNRLSHSNFHLGLDVYFQWYLLPFANYIISSGEKL